MQAWLRHVRVMRGAHTPGKRHIALPHGQASLNLSRKALPLSQPTWRVGAERGTWLRGMLSPALLSFTLFLAMLAGRPYAQEPPSGTEPELAPTVPDVPGPLETVPTASERILAPVPQQFNWLQREAPSNPLLESLLSLRGLYRFQVSASLYETVSDNFEHLPGSHRTAARTGVALSTACYLDKGQAFVSLANTERAFYEVPTDRG